MPARKEESKQARNEDFEQGIIQASKLADFSLLAYMLAWILS